MQSGITASQELLDAFKHFISTPSQRGLFVTITSEKLVPSHTLTSQGSFDSDLSQLDPLLTTTEPAYILLRRTPSKNSTSSTTSSTDAPLVAITYVPDTAPVRQKMLFASTRTTLLRELGTDRFSESIFCTTKAELTHEGFKAHDAHNKISAPLTEEERLLSEVKVLEAEASTGTSSRKAHVSSGIKFPLSSEAMFALKSLTTSTAHNLVQLAVDTGKETIELENMAAVNAEGLAQAISDSSPRYSFFVFHHTYEGVESSPIVFIYTCPPTSKIKERMIYASSRSSVISAAEKEAGLEISKKLEAAAPSDITLELLMEEFHPKKEEKAAFSRPKRPGRR